MAKKINCKDCAWCRRLTQRSHTCINKDSEQYGERFSMSNEACSIFNLQILKLD